MGKVREKINQIYQKKATLHTNYSHDGHGVILAKLQDIDTKIDSIIEYLDQKEK